MQRNLACILILSVTVFAGSACSRKTVDDAPPVATPSIKLSRSEAAIGSPVDVTYRFTMVPGAAPITEDLWVFVHVLDTDGEVLWTDDHEPPTPTREWRPGKTIEYTRTIFVPKLPFIGDARVVLGVYSPKTGQRLPLSGQNRGLREYQVGTLRVQSRPENLFVVFKSGWHDVEVAEGSPGVEWQWTRGEGILAFRNPKKDSIFFLQLDQPVTLREAQRVELRIGNDVFDTFTVEPSQRVLRRVKLSAARLGSGDTVEVAVRVSKTFVPAAIPELRNADSRELGVRVFRAFVETE